MGIKDTASKLIEFERNQRHAAAAKDAERKPERDASRAAMLKAKQSRAETKTAKEEARKAKREGYKGRDMNAVLPEAEREQILSKQIKKFAGWSSPWSVQERGKTSCTLIDKAGDPIGTGGVFMGLATLGTSLATAPIRRGRDNDKHLSINVSPNGTVERTGSLLYGGVDYSNVPMLED